ncbi:MAG: hypothetical protein DME18_10090, partial [Verrucomicrobia bacterium]
SARFASPNFEEGLANHRLALFLPSTPDFVAENEERASKPYELPANKTVTLDSSLVVAPGPANVVLREYLRDASGLPRPNPRPRSFQNELDACRAGFLKTLWNEKTERWSHCIGWAGSHAPGFAALLWLDSQVAGEPVARQELRKRVELAAQNMLRDSGSDLFTSQANCHIMQWEFPFLYGYLPEALASLEPQIRHLIESQQPAGGWGYEPANEQQSGLGQAGDSVLGTCANRAATLLRYARITGDAAALAAGEKALRFMENFRVPRGGQTWECPMYEPDILAAAYAIRAYHDGFRATGNPRWLHDAVYWAETGVPFIYLWSLPDKPMMLGATIPVFGSTYYTHSWLAMPVQWCGLVYAYHVFHLARELEHTPLPKTDSPLPLGLNLSPADWRRIVELITISGMYQQFADGERIGTYPDSISQFEKRNPAFINPEDILVNVLALQGFDPDVKTARLRREKNTIVLSSGAEIENLEATTDGIRFNLNFFPDEVSHSLVAGLKPKQVLAIGKPGSARTRLVVGPDASTDLPDCAARTEVRECEDYRSRANRAKELNQRNPAQSNADCLQAWAQTFCRPVLGNPTATTVPPNFTAWLGCNGLGLSGGKKVICEHKASDSLIRFLSLLYETKGVTVLEKLSKFSVNRGVLVSKRPESDYRYRSGGGEAEYQYQRISDSGYFALTQSATKEKVSDIRRAWQFLNFPSSALKVEEADTNPSLNFDPRMKTIELIKCLKGLAETAQVCIDHGGGRAAANYQSSHGINNGKGESWPRSERSHRCYPGQNWIGRVEAKFVCDVLKRSEGFVRAAHALPHPAVFPTERETRSPASRVAERFCNSSAPRSEQPACCDRQIGFH